ASEAVQLPEFLGSAQSRDLRRLFTQRDDFKDFLRHPWVLSFAEGSVAVDNVVSVALMMLLPLLLLCRVRRPVSEALVFGAALWLPLNIASHIGRFAMPALVPLSLAAAWPLAALEGFSRRAAEAAAVVVFALAAFYTFSAPRMFAPDLLSFW